METKLLSDHAADLLEAAALLQQGKVVGIPTETVYGLAADARNPEAVRQIFAAKGRPADNPLIVHIAEMQALEQVAAVVPPLAVKLAERFWPGPLTMILKRKPVVPDATTAGLDTVAIRCPNHPVTLEVIRKADIALSAPSANPSGKPSPKTAQEVLDYFDGHIEGIIDGGPCALGTESTIVDLTGETPVILREGAIPAQEILAVLGEG